MKKIWRLLNIEPTEDVRAIKKAYAAQVRNCHQEDEPERWQELHEAYQQALAYAQNRHRNIRMVSNHEPDERQANPLPNQKKSQADKDRHRQVDLEVQELEQDKKERVYTELFDEIEAEAYKKQKYSGIFPEFLSYDGYKYDTIMKEFLAKEEIQRHFGDIYFWKALEEYYSAYECKSVAWAWMLQKQIDAVKEGKLILDEKGKEELKKQQERIWARCVEKDGLFLPKRLPVQPLRVAKCAYALAVILGLGLYALAFWVVLSFVKWVLSAPWL